jgi:hypothetical protein
MANNLYTNPVTIESPQSSYKAAVASILGSLFVVRVNKVLWTSPKNAGDTLLIIDPQSGNNLLRMVAVLPYSGAPAAVPQVQDYVPAKLWSDFAVDQIDSGVAELFMV